MSEKDISRLAGEIADMAMNGASDEELKEAIKNSMAVIDANKNTATFDTSFADNGWLNHTCSNCGYTENNDIHVHYYWNYCPNCGARFIKPKEETADEEKSFEEAADELIKKCF